MVRVLQQRRAPPREQRIPPLTGGEGHCCPWWRQTRVLPWPSAPHVAADSFWPARAVIFRPAGSLPSLVEANPSASLAIRPARRRRFILARTSRDFPPGRSIHGPFGMSGIFSRCGALRGPAVRDIIDALPASLFF